MLFLILPAAYLLGSIPTGFLLVRLKTGQDVRQVVRVHWRLLLVDV